MNATDQIRASRRGSLDKLLDEEQAFLMQREQLRAQYQERFVAVHGGLIVDSDPDEFDLARRITKAYPNEDILICSLERDDGPVEMLSPLAANAQ